MRPDRNLSLIALIVVVLAGCKVTGEDVEEWKGTVKGPGKIVAVILSENYPMELRTEAALALVEMERSDVNGVAELQKTLMRLGEQTRQKIIAGMTPELKQMMRGGDSAEGDGDGPAPAQVQAKDAAYVLIPEAGKQARRELTDAVVSWYSVDFNGRSLAGNYSAEQVVRALGAPAARQLVDALNPRMPQVALVKIAELIGELGNEKTRSQAADKLVAIEKQMRTDEFKKWLETKIREELKKANPDEKPDPKRVEAIAVLNREKFINEGAIPAMKHLADRPVVADRLLEIAQVDSDNQMVVERRKRALQALEGHAKESQLSALLDLALNPKNPVPVRDYAFDRVGDIRSKKALSRLWPLVESTENQRLRWRAGEMVLHIGGPDVVPQFFSKLPSGDVEYAKEELEGYANRMSQMNPAPTEFVRKQLKSADWWDRVIALELLEREGTSADIERMQKLTDDKAEPDGPNWAEDATVGKAAEESLETLQEQLAQAEQAAQQG